MCIRDRVLAVVEAFIKLLEARFDSLKVQRREFEHLGLVHTQTDEYIEIHQNQYVSQLRPIVSADISKDEESELTPELQSSFSSLLGGAGWVVQTRPDAAVYIGALQRVLKKPLVKHLKRLNRVVRYLKAKPFFIRYRRVLVHANLQSFPIVHSKLMNRIAYQ